MVGSTQIGVSGKLTCSGGRPWCFHIVLAEQDRRHSHDTINSQGTKCIWADSFNYALSGSQNWDGVADNYFEVMTTIWHNCTLIRPKSILRVQREIIVVPIEKENFEFHWNGDLVDEGERCDFYTQY
ncbi:unnamed protein product [Caenorhabditis brenneri]